MNAKHTPGPWFWALDRNNQPTSLQRSGSGDSVISPQVELGDYGLSVHSWNDVSEADARLIAAAPVLLSELKDAVELILQLTKARWSEWEGSEEETVGSFRAAIANAEGPAARSANG